MCFNSDLLLKSARVLSAVAATYHARRWTSHAENGNVTSPLLKNDSKEVVNGHVKINPFDCPQPACASKLDLLKEAFKRQKSKTVADNVEVLVAEGSTKDSSTSAIISNIVPVSNSQGGISTSTDANSVIESDDDHYLPIKLASNCPLDREELGRSTWDLIHTVAAYYPDMPTDTDKENARNFVTSLAYLYPCEICRDDFKDSVSKNPPE